MIGNRAWKSRYIHLLGSVVSLCLGVCLIEHLRTCCCSHARYIKVYRVPNKFIWIYTSLSIKCVLWKQYQKITPTPFWLSHMPQHNMLQDNFKSSLISLAIYLLSISRSATYVIQVIKYIGNSTLIILCCLENTTIVLYNLCAMATNVGTFVDQ